MTGSQRDQPAPKMGGTLTQDLAIPTLVEQYRRMQQDSAIARASLERLAELCQPLAARIARTYVLHEADVADVVQETLLHLTSSLPQLRDPAAFPQWFAAIARNTSRQWLRREQPRRSGRALEAMGAALDELPALTDIRAMGAYQGVESRDLLQRLLRTLPRREQEVLMLSYLAGWSQQEIGKHLSVSPKAVESLLYRAVRRLREVASQCDGRIHELETWCPACGNHRLRGYLQPGETALWPLQLRTGCPGCAPGRLSFMVLPLPLDLYSSLDAALIAGTATVGAMVRQMAQTPTPTCPHCASPLVHERRWDTFELDWQCPRCGYLVHSALLGLAATLPAWQTFWRSAPHMLVQPHHLVKRGGALAAVAAARDPVSGRTANVSIACGSLRVRLLETSRQ